MTKPYGNGSCAPGDGRYLGNDGCWCAETRIDRAGSGRISADLHTTSVTGTTVTVSVATGRLVETDAGPWPVRCVGPWPVRCVDDAQGSATGALSLTAALGDEGPLRLHLTLDQALGPLPQGFHLSLDLVKVNESLRVLSLEVETEEGVDLQEEAVVEDGAGGERTVSISSCLSDMGYALSTAGRASSIPARPDGWSESDIFQALTEAMTQAAQAPLSESGVVHVLRLSHTSRRGLLGLMFTDTDTCRRQGLAIFVDEIKELAGTERQAARTVHTTMHELGHALNLRHRFEPEVGHARSTSFMNYPFCYRGGSYAEQYWADFRWSFDADELDFLRHGPRALLVPGGARFGSARYFLAEDAGTPVVPEIHDPRLRLWLTPPRRTTGFTPGQPVFLEVSVLNVGEEMLWLPRHLLDPKGGLLQLLVRPADRPEASPDDVFSPLVHRCYDTIPGDPATSVALAPGESLHTNVNLTFGSAGFPFPEPGEYLVTPRLAVATESQGKDAYWAVEGPPLTIQVNQPANPESHETANVLLRPDVGTTFALGGTDALDGALTELRALRSRREEHSSRREEHSDPADPIVAAVARVTGIHAGRRDRRAEAADDLTVAAGDAAEQAFDPHTVEHTLRLRARYRRETPVHQAAVHQAAVHQAAVHQAAVHQAASTAPDPADEHVPQAVIDLTVTVAGTAHQVRAAGLVVPTPGGHGRWVLAPADQLPAEVMTAVPEDVSASAVATIAADDGLSERVTAQSIRLIGSDSDGTPSLAVLTLTRPVPVPPWPDLPQPLARLAVQDPSQVWDQLDRLLPSTAGTQQLSAADLSPWAGAADAALDTFAALGENDGPPPTPTAPLERRRWADLVRLANWWCLLTPACQPSDPPEKRAGRAPWHRDDPPPGPPSDPPPSPPSDPPPSPPSDPPPSPPSGPLTKPVGPPPTHRDDPLSGPPSGPPPGPPPGPLTKPVGEPTRRTLRIARRGTRAARKPDTREVALAVAAGVLDLVAFSNVLTDRSGGMTVGLGILAYGVAGYTVLAWRRIAPVLVFCGLCLHLVGANILFSSYRPTLGLLVALYTVAATQPIRTSATLLAASSTATVVTALRQELAGDTGTNAAASTIVMLVLYALLNGGMWGLGRWAHHSRERITTLEDRRRRAVEEATAAERRRIAREIHDIVSHSVSLMVLQAAGAQKVLSTDPARAATALAHIEEAGKESMGELRRLLGVLKAGTAVADDDEVAPMQHGLNNIAHLIEPLQAGGLQVSVTVRGHQGRLDPSVDLSGYRIVQEALTNCLKHAGPGTRVTVDLVWSADVVVIEITDDGGSHTSVPELSIGQGLTGLRERARAVGGRLEAGPQPDGGFQVRTVLPVRMPTR